VITRSSKPSTVSERFGDDGISANFLTVAFGDLVVMILVLLDVIFRKNYVYRESWNPFDER
jgi:hypothetical protein